MYFDDRQVKHLATAPPLERPLVMIVSDHHGIEIDDALQAELDDLGFLQQHYRHIPGILAEPLRRLVSYRGRNPAWRTLSKTAIGLMKIELRVAGHGRAAPLFVKGLRLAEHLRNVGRSPAALAATDYASGVGYTSQKDDLAIARRYKSWIRRAAHFPTEEERLGTPFHFAIENTSAYLDRHPEIRRLINFGACYGIVEHEIARRHPGVTVFGVDRAELVRDFNDGEFAAPNLRYVAADILDFVRSRSDLSDTAFMFMRTAFIFPEAFMLELSKLLGARRLAAMIGIEPYQYSLIDRRLPEFSAAYKPSVLGRGGAWIHNYPHLASSAGLRVVQEKWLQPPQRTGDHKDAQRTYCFIAARTD